jgi:hypothetical protein
MGDAGRSASWSPAVPAEDRAFLRFMAASLGVALGAGLVLAVTTSPRLNQARLVQAHGWGQLQGWLGIFVAGMSLRLVPRLSGRRPLPRPLTLAVLSLPTAEVIGRVIAQTVDRAACSFPPCCWLRAGWCWSRRLSRSRWRGAPGPGRDGLAGMNWGGWWAPRAGLTVAAGIEGAGNGDLVPSSLDEPSTWLSCSARLMNPV